MHGQSPIARLNDMVRSTDKLTKQPSADLENIQEENRALLLQFTTLHLNRATMESRVKRHLQRTCDSPGASESAILDKLRNLSDKPVFSAGDVRKVLRLFQELEREKEKQGKEPLRLGLDGTLSATAVGDRLKCHIMNLHVQVKMLETIMTMEGIEREL